MIGVHDLELVDGVTPDEFEAFVSGPFSSCFTKPVGGLVVKIQKCDRGRGVGDYCAVWSFDSVARRNAYFPSDGSPTASFSEEVAAKLPPAWSRLWEMCDSVEFTDYVVMYATPEAESGAGNLYGVHDLVLADGVKPADFEKFVTGAFAEAWPAPVEGLGRAILVGERGERVGEYQNVFVFSPASLRDEFFPTPTTQSAFFRERVAPRMSDDIGERIRNMTVREGFSDWAPIAASN
ncbi:MAG: hypothetical protein GY895_20960 [Phycisphaera sp.]|nr:hypothetical protein [Phycisphaera sp.]